MFTTVCLYADIKPYECYEGAVYAFYNEKPVSRTMFAGVTTVMSGKIREELYSMIISLTLFQYSADYLEEEPYY